MRREPDGVNAERTFKNQIVMIAALATSIFQAASHATATLTVLEEKFVMPKVDNVPANTITSKFITKNRCAKISIYF